jgi:[ribosomal protein S5]-alanine N-acetyltransferase
MITTERLFLVPSTLPMLEAIVDNDLPALSAALGGVDIADQWYEDLNPMMWLRDFLREYNQTPEWWNYLFIHQHDVRLIGTGGYKGPPHVDGAVEIGYEIAESYRNRGLAREAAKGLCDNAFKHPEVSAVIAHTLAEENASVALLRKLGFQFVEEIMDVEDGLIWKWVLRR